MHLSSDEYMEGIKLYWGSKDCKMYQGEEASTNEASNQKIQWINLQKRRYQIKDRYYDKNLRECSK